MVPNLGCQIYHGAKLREMMVPSKKKNWQRSGAIIYVAIVAELQTLRPKFPGFLNPCAMKELGSVLPEAIHAKLIHPEADAGKKISLHLQRGRSLQKLLVTVSH